MHFSLPYVKIKFSKHMGEFFMKKKDFILIAIVLLAAFGFWLLPRGLGFFTDAEETVLKITVKGELYGTYSMRENQTIEINDTNICEIKDGKVTMIQAECPDHLCLRYTDKSTEGNDCLSAE